MANLKTKLIWLKLFFTLDNNKQDCVNAPCWECNRTFKSLPTYTGWHKLCGKCKVKNDNIHYKMISGKNV
jgi:hypothetical protein